MPTDSTVVRAIAGHGNSGMPEYWSLSARSVTLVLRLLWVLSETMSLKPYRAPEGIESGDVKVNPTNVMLFCEL